MEVIVDRTRRIREYLNLPQEEPARCPVAAEACDRGLWVRQSALLAEREDMDDIVRAARKVATAWK
ncbi:MAG: hypothetical protein GX649_17750, partial [Chloroflexi bacterium]|nr:hypothetical protein [Chloroflexota bacterium]